MSLPRRISEPGPLVEYIAQLEAFDRPAARKVIEAVRSVFLTPEGAIVLEFLDKAILERTLPVSADPRALDANNAQSFIALDLRRILTDEHDERTDQIPPDVGRSRRGRTGTGRT